MIGGEFHLEYKAGPLPRQDVDEVGGWQEANLPTRATPDHHCLTPSSYQCQSSISQTPEPPPVLVS